MSKHTAGPWEARPDDEDFYWVWVIESDPVQDRCIGRFTLADAQLIAAAPEMKACLHRLMGVFGCRSHKAVRDAQALLARLEGDNE